MSPESKPTQAFPILSALQKEVGNRRATTEGEVKAQAWLQERCRNLRLHVETFDYTFIGSQALRTLLGLIQLSILFTLIVLSRSISPIWIGLGLMLYFYYFNRVHKHVVLRIAQDHSLNLISGLTQKFTDYLEQKERPLVLICAHYDTPFNLPGWLRRFYDSFRVISPIVSLVLMLYLVYFVFSLIISLVARFAGIGLGLEAILASFWINTGFWVVVVVMVPMLVLNLIYMIDLTFRKQVESPGADDNGSGVALTLAMAERLKQAPPQNVDVFFAFWGAEELGLYGSRQFVRQFHSELDKQETTIINADTVGVGDHLLIHTGQGVVFRKRTNPQIVQALERITKEKGVATMRSWESMISGGSSDHAEWLDRGYSNAVSLMRENYRPLSLPAKILATLLRIPDASQYSIDHVHSSEDTLEIIDVSALEEAVDVCEGLVSWIDKQVSAG